jgi:hypothetical protein
MNFGKRILLTSENAGGRNVAFGLKARNPKSEISSSCGIFAGRGDSERQ